MTAKLKDKICVVTGATRGIGRGSALALAEEGATVYVTGRSTGEGELTVEGSVQARQGWISRVHGLGGLA